MTQAPQLDSLSADEARALLDRHVDFLESYPHYQGASVGTIAVPGGNGQVVYGIELIVSELTDPSTLPPERRVPDRIEGFPVIITVDTFEFTSEVK